MATERVWACVPCAACEAQLPRRAYTPCGRLAPLVIKPASACSLGGFGNASLHERWGPSVTTNSGKLASS